jgi:phospholipid transport system transporter-binding protein
MADEVMQLPASATLERAAALAGALPQALARTQATLRIDASALTALDTSTIALLMQGRRLAQGAGRGFEVVGAPAKLTALARLYGVEDLLSLSRSAST